MKNLSIVDQYFAKKDDWKEELILLRDLLQKTALKEEIKWGRPVYSLNKKNVLGIDAFKKNVSIWFFQGVFLQDKKKKLVNAQEGKTKAMRQWRFTSVEEIKKDKKIIEAYLQEAIANQKAGKEVKRAKATAVEIPPEMTELFSKNKALKKQFDTLTPGKQRDYFRHILEAKRAATKQKRLEQAVELIMAGKGIYDQYK